MRGGLFLDNDSFDLLGFGEISLQSLVVVVKFFEFLIGEDEVVLKFGINLREFFKVQLKLLVLLGVSIKFILKN